MRWWMLLALLLLLGASAIFLGLAFRHLYAGAAWVLWARDLGLAMISLGIAVQVWLRMLQRNARDGG
jgi:hypothetical protein